MGAYSNAHPEKVKVTFECTADERAFIKMLSARAHMTISEFLMSYVRPDFPSESEPNEETKKAMLDSRSKKNLRHAKTVGEFWDQMGIKRRA